MLFQTPGVISHQDFLRVLKQLVYLSNNLMINIGYVNFLVLFEGILKYFIAVITRCFFFFES